MAERTRGRADRSAGDGSRSLRRLVLAALAVVLVAAVGGGAYGIWFLFLSPPGPAAVGNGAPVIPSNAPAASTATPSAIATVGTAASVPAATTSTGSTGPASATDGTWIIDTRIGSFSDFTGSFVGYRVQEKLASIGANTAVGRTPDVSGSLTLQGTTLTAVDITAKLTSLKSDDARRDGQLSRQGIQTGQYPEATFKLTEPLDLGTLPADGQSVSVTAKGELTLHGVTKSVEIPIKATRSGDVIGVTGSLEIVFADYGITPPSSFMVLTIEDHGTMELQLFFRKA